jgi:23S rRNA pseudouridine2605 synthase
VRPERLCYGVLHKPRGVLTTLSDPEGRPTAAALLAQVGVRVVPVGRLDFNTSGALLFTNDGDFAERMTHARSGVPKVYAVTIDGIVDEQSLERWAGSIEIDGRRTRPAEVRILRRAEKRTWLEVTIREGRNRQVRRLGEHARTPVVRLARLSHAGITTEGLRPGQWRLLSLDELKTLKQEYGVPEKLRGVLEAAPGGPLPALRSNDRAPRRPAPRKHGPERPSGAFPRVSREASARPADRGGASPSRREPASVSRPRGGARSEGRGADRGGVSPSRREPASASRRRTPR